MRIYHQVAPLLVYIGIYIGRCLGALLRGRLDKPFLNGKLKSRHTHSTAGTYRMFNPGTLAPLCPRYPRPQGAVLPRIIIS